MILLLAFVLCFSYILSYTTTYYANKYGGQIVIEACAITMAIVIALTAYAFFTRTDFTTWVGIVIVIVVCFSFFGVSVAVRWNKTLNSLYCALGAILVGILLIIDTQMIVGGERSFKISMDDYVFGALVIYVDVIRLFIYILRGLTSKKKKKWNFDPLLNLKIDNHLLLHTLTFYNGIKVFFPTQARYQAGIKDWDRALSRRVVQTPAFAPSQKYPNTMRKEEFVRFCMSSRLDHYLLTLEE